MISDLFAIFLIDYTLYLVESICFIERNFRTNDIVELSPLGDFLKLNYKFLISSVY